MKVTKFIPQDGIRAKAHRKENHFMEEYAAIVFTKGEFKTPVTLRIYGTNAMNYACLWVHHPDNYCSGSGSAGGYGYHRPSAAAQEAITAAGIQLDERIDGRGDSATHDAVLAIAKKLYPRSKVYIHKAHA